jgi:xanthine dehydrogenase iron-sulfur cluster and FAD-binding subunit A
VRASAAYRLAVAGNLLTRAFLEIQGGEPLSMRGGQHA